MVSEQPDEHRALAIEARAYPRATAQLILDLRCRLRDAEAEVAELREARSWSSDVEWLLDELAEAQATIERHERIRSKLLCWCDEDSGSIKGYMKHADIRKALGGAVATFVVVRGAARGDDERD